MSDLENINYIWATAIEEWIAQGRLDEQIHAVRNFFSGKGVKAMQATSDLIAQEANKAQLQLVSELLQTAKKGVPDYKKLDVRNEDMLTGYELAATELISELEHKKQELERGE